MIIKRMRCVMLGGMLLFLLGQPVKAQLGFFESFWAPQNRLSPLSETKPVTAEVPGEVVTIHVEDTLRKISPYVGGYNLNTYYGGKIFNKPLLLENIRQLALPFVRYPGGSGSNWYFWDRAKPDLPEDVDYMIIKGEKEYLSDKIKWGSIPGADYLSLENSYVLRDSLGNEAIHVINYPYARYGRSAEPVAQAAHYAAEWVRHDNGRTRFWEIGNEIYGSWEPGYIIDTTRNQDGQPRQITGELYAQHCLVFLDSMRAAAAEIGADIKIGATLGFQERRSDWDVPVIQGLTDQVDFYIVHKYFGTGNDATPAEVFASIDEFYQHKAHIDGLINQYCDSYVPLVITEWNTRFEGSRQNVSCANGMHNVLGYKAIINEGLGLSCKWNLIWGYKNGSTHGLIAGEKDDPTIEGLPAYHPRAPYYYIYYFKQFLGDVSVSNSADPATGVEVFSSAYTSGHTGIVLVNTSDRHQTVGVNLEDYRMGDHYYYYMLDPADGTAFSRKVKVNGKTNSSYDAGGPDNISELKPYGTPAEKGIRVPMKPYSTAFLLTEGQPMTDTLPHQVTFQVTGEDENGLSPLEGAAVLVDKRLYLTNAEGEVSVMLSGGTVHYTLEANGYGVYTGSLALDGDRLVQDTLQALTYTVGVELKDAETESPIEGCMVSLENQEKRTDASGSTVFSDVAYGRYVFDFSHPAYKTSFDAGIFADTTLVISLEKTPYRLQFNVLDGINGNPIPAAQISIDGNLLYTSLEGEETFIHTYGLYDYSVNKNGYKTISDQVELVNDSVLTVALMPESADIKFRLYEDAAPVNGATVALDGAQQMTNALGICTFSGLATEASYSYTVTNAPYDPITGNVYLLTDTTVDLNYIDFSYAVGFRVTDHHTDTAVEGAGIALNGVYRVTDEEGAVSFTLPYGTYDYAVDRDRYNTLVDKIEVTHDTLVEVSLDLMEAIVRFRVSYQETLLEGALVAMDGKEYRTNSLGMTVFNDVLVDSAYDYRVSAVGYDARHATLLVVHDTTVVVDLAETHVPGAAAGDVRIFPVPARDRIWLQTGFRMKELRLADLRGKNIQVTKGRGRYHAEMPLPVVRPGLYLLHIKGYDEQDIVIKVVLTGE